MQGGQVGGGHGGVALLADQLRGAPLRSDDRHAAPNRGLGGAPPAMAGRSLPGHADFPGNDADVAIALALRSGSAVPSTAAGGVRKTGGHVVLQNSPGLGTLRRQPSRPADPPIPAGEPVACWGLLVLAWIDGQHLRLPDVLTLPLVPVGLAVTPWLEPDRPVAHAAGVATGELPFRGFAGTCRRLRARGARSG